MTECVSLCVPVSCYGTLVYRLHEWSIPYFYHLRLLENLVLHFIDTFLSSLHKGTILFHVRREREESKFFFLSMKMKGIQVLKFWVITCQSLSRLEVKSQAPQRISSGDLEMVGERTFC